jgi:threonine/homoserine/homoserine lactone efflux protein
LVLLGSICVALNTLVDVLAVLGADRLLHSSATRTTRTRVLNYACGGTLVALGIFLATTRRDA